VVDKTPHPARFSTAVLDTMAELLHQEIGKAEVLTTPRATPRAFSQLPINVLDPYAGVGGVHELRDPGLIETIGVEIEPEWASQHPNTICGDTLRIDKLFLPETFDAVCVSPTYANRMADHHNARDGSRRITYKHYLGRDLHPSNSGQMQWGPDYKLHHVEAWGLVVPLIKSGGVFILNVKDHIRKWERVRVTYFHVRTLTLLGLTVDYANDVHPVSTPGMKFGENREKRVPEGEFVIVLHKP
jgi:hypothetical protein